MSSHLRDLEDDLSKYGNEWFCLKKLYDCDPQKIEDLNAVPCPFGGMFLKSREKASFVDIFNNTGTKVISCQFSFLPLVCQMFWCSGGRIGFLKSNGDVVICRLSGEILGGMKCPEKKANVKFAYPFLSGIAIVTESKAFCVYDFSTERYEKYFRIKSKADVLAICFWVSGG